MTAVTSAIAVQDAGHVELDDEAVPGRSTRAIINLDALAGNLTAFRRGITPGTRVMAVVKANGYGHGSTMIARTALEAGADELAVATVDEGIKLRDDGIEAPILVLSPIHESEISTAITARLALTVASTRMVDLLRDAVVRTNAEPISLHLKVDTGMHRFGCMPDEAVMIASRIVRDSTLRLAGVMSHFASADETDESSTRAQMASFSTVLERLTAAGIDPGIRHIANSAATLRSRDYDLDMVRIGIALYGIPPSSDVALWPGMTQVLTVRSRIHRVIELEPGDGVSYGATYRAAKRERAGLVPIGYADGYHRALSNRASMDVNGQLAPVRGRVCMDQTVIGIPASAEVGDDVVVVSDGSGSAPTLPQLADLAGTIPYELATSVAVRVPRHYVRHGQLVAIETLARRREIN